MKSIIKTSRLSNILHLVILATVLILPLARVSVSQEKTAAGGNVHHPLIDKVFPEVQIFYKEGTYNALPELAATVDGYRYELPWEFNLLFDKAGERNDLTNEEKIEAFVRLFYWNVDSTLDVDFIIPEIKIVDEITYNYRLAYKFDIKDMIRESGALVSVEDGQIARFAEFASHTKDFRYFNCVRLITPVLLKTDPADRSIQHVRLSQVFPGVEFTLEAGPYPHSTEEIIAHAGKDDIPVPDGFYTIPIKGLTLGYDYTKEQYIEAFIRLFYWLQDPDLELVELNHYQFSGLKSSTYKAKVRIKDNKAEPVDLDLVMDMGAHSSPQIFQLREYREGELQRSYGPFIVSDKFDGKLIGSTPFVTPALSEVFPGVEFNYEKSALMDYPRISAWQNYKKFVFPWDFLALSDSVWGSQVPDRARLIEAFVALLFQNKNIQVKSIKVVSKRNSPYHECYRTNIKVTEPGDLPRKGTLMVYMDQNHIVAVESADYDVALILDASYLNGGEVKLIPISREPAKEGDYVQKSSIEFPLLDKVFPGVKFSLFSQDGAWTGGPDLWIMANYDTLELSPGRDFSKLMELSYRLSESTTEEKVLASIWLSYYQGHSTIKVLSLEKTERSQAASTYNYRALASIHSWGCFVGSYTQQKELWIQFDRNSFSSIDPLSPLYRKKMGINK